VLLVYFPTNLYYFNDHIIYMHTYYDIKIYMVSALFMTAMLLFLYVFCIQYSIKIGAVFKIELTVIYKNWKSWEDVSAHYLFSYFATWNIFTEENQPYIFNFNIRVNHLRCLYNGSSLWYLNFYALGIEVYVCEL